MPDVSDELGARLRPPLETLLEAGEQLTGMCLAVQQGAFRGSQMAIGVTEPRLLVQPMDRRFEPKGEPIVIKLGQLAYAEAEGAGAGWINVVPAIMSHYAVRLKLRTIDGTKLKLYLMRGGDALMGRLGGGQLQEDGLMAIAGWLERHGEPRY